MTTKGWNGDLTALTDEQLAAYARHCQTIGVHPTSKLMSLVKAEMLRRYPPAPHVTVTLLPRKAEKG